ncbi:MAG: hypothetical protein COB54_03295 [Alphaproteobacteria bacterium]|nr:MAG: hypothetical protein COB54_03295 [Alphaproteobacteria bacterium]
MSSIFKATATAAVLSCALSISTLAQNQLSPDIMNLLIVASERNNGSALDIVAEIALAANPAAAEDIHQLVATLKLNQSAKPAKTIAPPPVATPKAQTVAKIAPATELAGDQPGYFSFKGWDGEAELNFLRSSGNTSQESLGLAGKIHRDSGEFHHVMTAFIDRNKNTGVIDKQRWGLTYKLDYDFSEKLYITGFAGYENDQFGAFRERITSSLGIGYPVIRNDSYSWKLEGGPSVLFTRELPGEGYISSFNGFASSIFGWTINDRSNFSNNIIFYLGEKNVIESKSALTVKINGALSSKFSYDIMYDRDAPLDRNRTDTVARAGLLYDF